ncbi:MAG: Txe/YoeB family addiction module toxin [Clostridia bacterium]
MCKVRSGEVYLVVFSRAAQKDKALLAQAGLASKAIALIQLLCENPFQNPPSYEKLKGDFEGYYSRRINRQHRLVYTVDEAAQAVHILRMWTHYE